MQPLSGILFGLFRGSPQHDDWVIACLEGAWPALVSEKIAQVCRPTSVRSARLTIEITDAAWDEELRRMEPELLQRIRQGTAGEIRELHFAPR
jgi:predicted nucleic acid-binding Zn ribbon protein